MPKAITKYTTNCRALSTVGRSRSEKERAKRAATIEVARRHYPWLAMGARLLTRTPDQLLAGQREIGINGLKEVEEALRTTAEWFDGLGKTMACIHARWLCVGARSVVEGAVP